MMRQVLCFFILLISFVGFSQSEVQMPVDDNEGDGFVFVGCNEAIFTDSQGSGANYLPNESGQVVLTPVIRTDRMILEFTQIDLRENDVLTIYDGDDTDANVLAVLTNTTTIPAAPFQASDRNINPRGQLTVTFTSNGSQQGAGWEARRYCFDPCQDIETDITTVPSIDSDGILRICQGDEVEFTGGATFSNDGAGATYFWDLDDGNGFNEGQVQSATYTEPGIYQTRLEVTDAEGCQDRQIIDLVVQVSTDPDFNGTRTRDTEICLGDSTVLTGVVNPREFRIDPAPPVTGQTFLPDGSGVSYQTCIDVDIFEPGQSLVNAQDLIGTLINIEHSFMGDLSIVLTAPNGSSVTILPFPNSGGPTFLGQPIDDDRTDAPGIGFDYFITEGPRASVSLSSAASGVGTIPAGNYRPQESYANLIGTNLNGEWCLTVTDNLSSDNGYIFEWGLTFSDDIIPDDLNFTPITVREEWQADTTIEAINGNEITVRPDALGTKCYTYEYEDNFGCIYTQEICITVNDNPAASQDPEDLIVCNTGSIQSTIDLTVNTDRMLSGQGSNLEVDFYLSRDDATNDVNAISDPEEFESDTMLQTIYAVIRNNTTQCESIIYEFETSLSNVTFNEVDDLNQCDDASRDGIEVFNLNSQLDNIIGEQDEDDYSVTYYTTQADADSGNNAIVNPEAYQNTVSSRQTIFARIENDSNADCFQIGSFDIIVADTPIANTVDDIEFCEDIESPDPLAFDLNVVDNDILGMQEAANFEISYHLSNADASNGSNTIDAGSFSLPSTTTTVFARIQNVSNTTCFDTISFEITALETPRPSLEAEYLLCRDNDGTLISGPAILDTGLNNDTNFEWKRNGETIAGAEDAIYEATEPGNYQVIAINDAGCDATALTTVRIAGPPETFNVETISQPFEENQTIVVTAAGPDEYIFRLDDGPFQNSGEFNRVSPGLHTITIAERQGCGSVTTQVFVFGYPDFFTPNADGFNDFWNVAGGDLLEGSQIFIFDRYGKFIKELSPVGAGWDGTFNGEPLPSSDYWFKVEYVIDGAIGEAGGHFTLKR